MAIEILTKDEQEYYFNCFNYHIEFMRGDTIHIYSIDSEVPDCEKVGLAKGILRNKEDWGFPNDPNTCFEVISNGKILMGLMGIDYQQRRICICRLVLVEKYKHFNIGPEDLTFKQDL